MQAVLRQWSLVVVRLSSHDDPRLYSYLHEQLCTLSHSLYSLLIKYNLILISHHLPSLRRGGRLWEIKVRIHLIRRSKSEWLSVQSFS